MEAKLADYLTSALKVLSDSLGAESGTLSYTFNENEGEKCKTYKNTASVIVAGNQATLYVFLNEKDKYGNYHDVVLCQAVDSFCETVAKCFMSNREKWFYDQERHYYLAAEEFAWMVHEEIQKTILCRYSVAAKINFEDIILLSEMLYESESTQGSIAFLINEGEYPPELLNKTLVQFSMDEPIDFSRKNTRYIRKLLAGAGKNTLLFISDNQNFSFKCYGYIKSDISLPYVVTFKNKFTWTLKHGISEIFRVKNRKILCTQDKLKIFVNELKSELNPFSSDIIEKIVKKISEQRHGTSIVFMDLSSTAHKARMDSLVKNGRAVNIKNVNPLVWVDSEDKSLCALTRVDGATIIDINSQKIAYINTIVDGISIGKGDYASGARHNAITCFVDNIIREDPNHKVAALIFSESGSFELIKGSERKLLC